MKTIDQATLEGLLELDRDTGGTLLTEMLISFRTDHPAQLEAMMAHITARNGSAVSFQAHAMRSTFTNFGANHLSEVLHRIEVASRVADWITIEIASEEMRAELRDFHQDLIEIEKNAQLSNAKNAA